MEWCDTWMFQSRNNWFFYINMYACICPQLTKLTCHWAATCPDTSVLVQPLAMSSLRQLCAVCVCSPCLLVWALCPPRKTAASWRPPGSDQSRTARAGGRYQPVVNTNQAQVKNHTYRYKNVSSAFNCIFNTALSDQKGGEENLYFTFGPWGKSNR